MATSFLRGNTLIMSAGFDLSDYTGLELNILRPDGTQLSVGVPDGLAVGQTDNYNTMALFPARTWVAYVIQDGDLPMRGPYSTTLTYAGPKGRPVIEECLFTVP